MKYIYKTETITDRKDGSIDTTSLQKILDENSREGWRLVSTLSNELGKNMSAGGFGGISIGSNSTIEEFILIFEKQLLDNDLTDIRLIPIQTTNAGISFVPKELLFHSDKNKITEIAVTLKAEENSISGLRGCAVLHTIFGEHLEIDGLEFTGFTKEFGKPLTSTWSYVPVPVNFSSASIKQVDFYVSKWVAKDTVYSANIDEHISVDLLAEKVTEEAQNNMVPIPVGKTNIQCPKCLTVQNKSRASCFHCGFVFPS